MRIPCLVVSILVLLASGAAATPVIDLTLVPGHAVKGDPIGGQLRVRCSGVTEPLELSLRVTLVSGHGPARPGGIRAGRSLPLDVDRDGTHVFDLRRDFPMSPTTEGDHTLVAAVAALDGGVVLAGSTRATSQITVGERTPFDLIDVELHAKPTAVAGKPVRGYVLVRVGQLPDGVASVDVGVSVEVSAADGADEDSFTLPDRPSGKITKFPLSTTVPVAPTRGGPATLTVTATALVNGRLHRSSRTARIEVEGEGPAVFVEPDGPLVVLGADPVRVGQNVTVVVNYRVANRSREAVEVKLTDTATCDEYPRIAGGMVHLTVPPGEFRTRRLEGTVRVRRAGAHRIRVWVRGEGVDEFRRAHTFLVAPAEETRRPGGTGGRFEILKVEVGQKDHVLDSPIYNAVFTIKVTYRIHPDGVRAKWMHREVWTRPDGEVIRGHEAQDYSDCGTKYAMTRERVWKAGSSGEYRLPGTYRCRLTMEGEGFETWTREFSFTVRKKE